MLHKLTKYADRHLGFTSASAHCDIPCKIYDPSTAQIAALTIIRLIDLIDELDQKDSLTTADQAQLSRLVQQKEEHGLELKEAIRVIWGDYFKQPQLEKFPEIHELTHNIMLQASKAKQHIDRTHATKLLELVNRFAEIFWETKSIPTFKAICPYPPSEVVIYPDIKP